MHHTNLEEHDADAKKFVCYNCGVACDLGEMRAERRDFLVKLGALTRKAKSGRTSGQTPHQLQTPHPWPSLKPVPGRTMRTRQTSPWIKANGEAARTSRSARQDGNRP